MCNYQAYGPWHGRRYGYAPWAHKFGHHFRRVPVNIEEKKETFELLLFAPALKKENIHLSVKDDTLIVSYQPEEETKQNEQFTRHEYHNQAFERSFVLNGKVEVEKISASYADGILKIILPKNPERNKPAQDISIA